MGRWDPVFDETYLQTYLPMTSEERSREQALAAVALAEVEPGAELLDCPCGFGRHAIPLAEAGYLVTGLDRSESQLAEAERRRDGAEWPQFVRGDYRELPFGDASFDAVLTLFSSLGYLERDGDVGVLRELRRVLRPGRTLVVETAHATHSPAARSGNRGSGSLMARSTSRSGRSTGPRGHAPTTASSSPRPASASSAHTSSASTRRRSGSRCSGRQASQTWMRSEPGTASRRSRLTPGD